MIRRHYCRWLKDSTLWAVEFDGPRALRAAGPLQPADLVVDIATRELPITLAGEGAPALTLRLLVKLRGIGLQRVIDGAKRRGIQTDKPVVTPAGQE